ncbi:MAG: metal-binding protein [Pseudomonadota bacterium]|nr:metal-binding protein [Pseudomonadota bacterium]
MAERKELCVLCSLEIEGRAYELETEEGTLRFCCDGCLGIYRLLNDLDEETEPAAKRDVRPG